MQNSLLSYFHDEDNPDDVLSTSFTLHHLIQIVPADMLTPLVDLFNLDVGVRDEEVCRSQVWRFHEVLSVIAAVYVI